MIRAICASVVAVVAAIFLAPVVLATSITYSITNPTNQTNWLTNAPADLQLVITPGTDDTGLEPRNAGLMAGRDTSVVKYHESFGPIIAGKSGMEASDAPSYDESRQTAVQHNVQEMRSRVDDGVPTLYTGYSQGSDALGNAAELAVRQDLLDADDTVLLNSDPRGPWGIKQFVQSHVPDAAMTAVDMQNDGARDPADTGDARVVSTIATADPAANWQWRDDRPAESLLVNAAGFLGCHSSSTSCYATLPEYGEPDTLQSADGNTTYLVYQTDHPLTTFAESVAVDSGMTVTDTQRDWMNAQAESFYPISSPSPDNAAVAVEPAAPMTLADLF